MEGADRSFRAHIVAPVLAYVRERGGDEAALLRRCALPSDAASRPYVDLPLRALHEFLERAASTADDDALGVRVGLRLERSTWDLLQLSCMSAPTLGDALAKGARLIALFNDYVELSVAHDARGVTLEHTVHGFPEGLSRHGNEHWMVALLARARQVTGAALAPEEAWFGHARPRDPEPLFAALGQRAVYFGAGRSGLRLSRDDAARPLRTADPVLASVLERLSEPSLAALQGRRGVAAQVARALATQLDGAVPELRSIARQLGLSTRSLQRALTAQGTSYRALVEQARRERARALFAAGAGPDELTARLGYSERSAFLRACARWAGARAPR